MNYLSLDRINAKAPYQVVLIGKQNLFLFKSDYGVEFAVSFDESLLMTSMSVYELSITNRNNRQSPRDRKIRTTVGVIVEEFFRVNQTGILYICETGDNKQAMRNRLFVSWIAIFNRLGEYEVHSASLHDAEGVENYAAMIVRKDNPRYQDYLSTFDAEVEFFNNKPTATD